MNLLSKVLMAVARIFSGASELFNRRKERYVYARRLNGRYVLPDDLSGEVNKITIDFDEPVLPARIIENLDSGLPRKNPLPDRVYTLYDLK